MRLARPFTFAVVGSIACFGSEPEVVGPPVCTEASGEATTGCALIFGRVVGPTGQALDGISGSIRPSIECACTAPALSIDDAGRYSVTVRRLAPRATSVSDTGTVVVAVFATAPKYPRHHTGGFYFDTASVVLRFASLGAAPVPAEVNLRIPLP
jgi:hypothetical protein